MLHKGRMTGHRMGCQSNRMSVPFLLCVTHLKRAAGPVCLGEERFCCRVTQLHYHRYRVPIHAMVMHCVSFLLLESRINALACRNFTTDHGSVWELFGVKLHSNHLYKSGSHQGCIFWSHSFSSSCTIISLKIFGLNFPFGLVAVVMIHCHLLMATLILCYCNNNNRISFIKIQDLLATWLVCNMPSCIGLFHNE